MSVERTLHHFSLDPFSRQVRLALGEKKLPFSEVAERYWERPDSLAALNPSAMPPVLVETQGGMKVVICESRAILEHLEERHPDYALMPDDAQGRAEVRRLLHWFDRKFTDEVGGFILHEKMEKRLLSLGAPDLAVLRRGREALKTHMEMIEGLLARRDWLAGPAMSMADLAAGANLSVIDYMGETPWQDFPMTRMWYAKLKSRPSFRRHPRRPGRLVMAPAGHYDGSGFLNRPTDLFKERGSSPPRRGPEPA